MNTRSSSESGPGEGFWRRPRLRPPRGPDRPHHTQYVLYMSAFYMYMLHEDGRQSDNTLVITILTTRKGRCVLNIVNCSLQSAWVGVRVRLFVCLFVCLSVCLFCLFVCLSAAATNDWSQTVQTLYRQWLWDTPEVVLFWGSKVKGRQQYGVGSNSMSVF